MRSRPDLIVPIHDRRKRKRYLTLKNSAIVFGVLLVAFTLISIRSEMRNPDEGQYGRIVAREITQKVERKPVETVTEQTPAVADASHADPMLVAPAAREQWLLGDPQEPAAVTMTALPTAGTRAETAVATGETRVAIVGGTEGVTIVQQTRRQPVLAGGFGRQ